MLNNPLHYRNGMRLRSQRLFTVGQSPPSQQRPPLDGDPPCGQTDTCEILPCPKLRLRAVISSATPMSFYLGSGPHKLYPG